MPPARVWGLRSQGTLQSKPNCDTTPTPTSPQPPLQEDGAIVKKTVYRLLAQF